MTNRLLMLMKDEDLRKRMGAAAFARSERYTEERIMKQWMDLFEEVAFKK